MKLKNGFTLIEIIIVLVIISIIGGIVTNIISNISKRYIIDYQYKLLDMQTSDYINKLDNLLSGTISNTVIGDKCNLDNDDCYNGNYTSFNSLEELTQEGKNFNYPSNKEYPVIEFYKENNYIKYFQWNENKKLNIPLSSKFVDLKDTTVINSNENEYNITVKYSNIKKVFDTLNLYLNANKVDENSSSNNNTVLLMSGEFDNGDISDINNSYGYMKTKSLKLFNILDYKHYDTGNVYNNYDILHIKPVSNLDGLKTEPYQSFFIINSAYALVPKKNSNGLLDIYLYQFYKPWKGQTYKDAKSKVLFMKNLSDFEIKSVNHSLFVKICKQVPASQQITNDLDFKVCKEYFKY